MTNKESEEVLERIEEISDWLGEARGPAFYFEEDYSEIDALKADEDAHFVLEEIKKLFLKES